MTGTPQSGRVRPTRPTRVAVVIAVALMAGTASFLLARYSGLPYLLPVHFSRRGYPDGWQFKTYARVLLPVFVQTALAVTLGAVGLLLLSRPHGEHDEAAPDVRAASIAAETVALLALIWIAFQTYASFALAGMWQRERAGLGSVYLWLEWTGIVLTLVVSVRAHVRLGHPTPRPFVPEHWRYGQLYRNPLDPALFVPTRDGSRWTLNFGRPVAAVLIAALLAIGIVGPAIILGLLLR
jgi:uncharacterized membrane protein